MLQWNMRLSDVDLGSHLQICGVQALASAADTRSVSHSHNLTLNSSADERAQNLNSHSWDKRLAVSCEFENDELI